MEKKHGFWLKLVLLVVLVSVGVFYFKTDAQYRKEFEKEFFSAIPILNEAEAEALTSTFNGKPTTSEVWDCGPSTSNHSLSYYADEKGKVWADSAMHDYCVLVGPRVEGEKIFVPEDYLCDSMKTEAKSPHWFYRDQCTLVTQPVYVLRAGGGENGKYEVYSYDPSDPRRESRKEEPREYDSQFIVIAPKFEGYKLILNGSWYYPESDPPKRVYWINRSDMIWVNPPAK